MKITKQNPKQKAFQPITIEITIESYEELEVLATMAGMTSTIPSSMYKAETVNYNIAERFLTKMYELLI